MQYQFTPPHIHQCNAAESAICTFKNHFISGLCSVDKNFLLHLWCCLLDQAELTLNMLHTSRINPNLSAHEQLHGIHDFNATPLAPPGTKCIAHEKSSQRGMWAPHGQHGWYVGAAPEHYRCYQIYIPKTQGTRICDTVEFFPTHCKMPNVSAYDAAIYAANDLITALTKPQLTNSFISIGDDQIVALRKLATIFQTSITKPPISDPGVPDIAPPSVHTHAVKPKNLLMQPLQHRKAPCYLKPNPNQPLKRNKRRTWSLTPQQHRPQHQTTHHPHYCQLMPAISHKTRGTAGRSIPPHPISKLSHGPQHRKASRVQTTHQSPRQQNMQNMAMLECK